MKRSTAESVFERFLNFNVETAFFVVGLSRPNMIPHGVSLKDIEQFKTLMPYLKLMGSHMYIVFADEEPCKKRGKDT